MTTPPRLDAESLAAYIEQHRPQLMAFIERQLGTALRRKVEPDDIYQEVCTDAVRSVDEMDLSQREPFSWLCQLAERRIIDAHRRYFGAQKRDAGREVALNADAGGGTRGGGLINMLVNSMTTPSAAFSRNARESQLQQAIATLPEEQATALRLRYVDGLPTKQVAMQLGKSDVATRVLLTRTLKKLQTMLREDTTTG
ncbi:MAG: sigma-70 family RNA polymerase sigma factor [Pirellulaceae bacterium]|nr:sigma-70 family RNA polymerase sigma factor [Planctomycetales bacterium]MCA9163170.1 sigma-70 family RNA polymerase sigma factor [Planctomycetales bacterium]MCA9221536.1 sigma-70 family RNA polymerase sigma factor [Planctomycetales bacterium]